MYYLGRLSDKDIETFAVEAYNEIPFFKDKQVTVKALKRSKSDVTLSMQSSFYYEEKKERVYRDFCLKISDFKIDENDSAVFVKNSLEKSWLKFLTQKFSGYPKAYKYFKKQESEKNIEEMLK